MQMGSLRTCSAPREVAALASGLKRSCPRPSLWWSRRSTQRPLGLAGVPGREFVLAPHPGTGLWGGCHPNLRTIRSIPLRLKDPIPFWRCGEVYAQESFERWLPSRS